MGSWEEVWRGQTMFIRTTTGSEELGSQGSLADDEAILDADWFLGQPISAQPSASGTAIGHWRLSGRQVDGRPWYMLQATCYMLRSTVARRPSEPRRRRREEGRCDLGGAARRRRGLRRCVVGSRRNRREQEKPSRKAQWAKEWERPEETRPGPDAKFLPLAIHPSSQVFFWRPG